MSIEAAIHEIIGDSEIPDAVALLALLPAERIVTGTVHDQNLPYATINLESNAAEYRSSAGGLRRFLVRFQVWHENHASGVAIRDAIEQLFENKSFSTDAGAVIQTRHENSLALQEDDGVWQFVVDVSVIK